MNAKEILLKHMINHLIKLCQEELGINQIPKINIINDQDSIEGSSFGEFKGDSIDVIATNRHPVDVMRTLAHELVHWQQSISGKDIMDGSTGSEIENEANAKAGIIMRKFGKKYPEFFINTLF